MFQGSLIEGIFLKVFVIVKYFQNFSGVYDHSHVSVITAEWGSCCLSWRLVGMEEGYYSERGE